MKIKWVFGKSFSIIGILAFLALCTLLVLELYLTDYVSLTNILNLSPYFASSLAFLAIGFTLSSDIKMDINSNENFLRIVDRFEDKRIDLFQHNSGGKYDLIFESCWKFRTYMNRAIKLYEMANIDKECVTPLFNQLEVLMFMSAIPWRGVYVCRVNLKGEILSKSYYKSMRRKDVNNILIVAKDFRKFKLTNIQKIKLNEYTEFLEFLLEKYYPPS